MIDEVEDAALPSELDSLKKRADLMQIKYHPSIGLEALRAKINEAVTTEGPVVQEPEATTMPDLAAVVAAEQSAAPQAPAPVAVVAKLPEPETAGEKKNRLRREATKLVRIRITCMNPAKKKWGGDMFCVSNRNFGNVQRYVPFERDWHVEAVLLDMIRERQYLTFDAKKTKISGIDVKEPRYVPEFAIADLDPLTPTELHDLAQRQAMASGTQE